MGDYEFMLLASLSVVIPLTAGLIKYKKIPSIYKPFLYFIFTSAFIEFLAEYVLFLTEFKDVVLLYNLYFLVEAYILLLLFKRWDVFKKKPSLFIAFIALFIIIWIAEFLIRDNIKHINSVFVISYSFVIIVLSLIIINQCQNNYTKKLIHDPRFIICISFLIFYAYTIFTESFSINPLLTSKAFRWKLLHMLNIVYAIANLLYFFGILAMPKKLSYNSYA